MKAYRTLDLSTERGRKIYNNLSECYPSLNYGWNAKVNIVNGEFVLAE